MATTFRYDGSFAGLLCALVEAYRGIERTPDAPCPRITAAGEAGGLFELPVAVSTDLALAERAEAALERRGGFGTARRVYAAFLAEEPGIENDLLEYVQQVATLGKGARDALLVPAVRRVKAAARRTEREVHRMHAFVRFRRSEAGVSAAVIEPVCDVLPLLDDHFVARYPAQAWVIFDARRGYGLRYADRALSVVTAPPDADATAQEQLYQKLWRSYYEAVDIPERRGTCRPNVPAAAVDTEETPLFVRPDAGSGTGSPRDDLLLDHHRTHAYARRGGEARPAHLPVRRARAAVPESAARHRRAQPPKLRRAARRARSARYRSCHAY